MLKILQTLFRISTVNQLKINKNKAEINDKHVYVIPTHQAELNGRKARRYISFYIACDSKISQISFSIQKVLFKVSLKFMPSTWRPQ